MRQLEACMVMHSAGGRLASLTLAPSALVEKVLSMCCLQVPPMMIDEGWKVYRAMEKIESCTRLAIAGEGHGQDGEDQLCLLQARITT